MIQAGYPPKMLQEIMGHASITTTLDLYGHRRCGQMTVKTSRTRNDQRVCLGKQERARRDSNPQRSQMTWPDR